MSRNLGSAGTSLANGGSAFGSPVLYAIAAGVAVIVVLTLVVAMRRRRTAHRSFARDLARPTGAALPTRAAVPEPAGGLPWAPDSVTRRDDELFFEPFFPGGGATASGRHSAPVPAPEAEPADGPVVTDQPSAPRWSAVAPGGGHRQSLDVAFDDLRLTVRLPGTAGNGNGSLWRSLPYDVPDRKSVV